jgi:trk system potassium uptake protein
MNPLISQHRASHFYMLIRQFGFLLIMLGYVLLIPVLVSLIYAEYFSAAGFFLSSMICLFIGFFIRRFIDSSYEPMLRDALVIAAIGWMLIVVFGALPYIITAYITPMNEMLRFIPAGAHYSSSMLFYRNPLHAIFESMSGYTTTGLTIAVNEPSVGKGLLFYRCYSQWIGGAGFIVLSLAILKQTNGKTAFLLYGSESTGERLRPTILETARSIWKVYLGLTIFSTLFLVIGTRLILPNYSVADNIFDSLNHAMAGQSTGGFSNLDDSIAGYHSAKMEFLYLLPMILGSLSLPFFYKVLVEKRYQLIWKDSQTRAILILSLVGSLVLSLFLLISKMVPEPFRAGTFQFISALSTTGWQTVDVRTWDSASMMFVIFGGMVIGGAFGATVGGIKIIRVLLIFKGLRWRVNSFFQSPGTINVVKFNNKRYLPEEMSRELASAATFSFIYLMFVAVSALITYFLMGDGFSMADALFESASAQGTVGLSSGITSPYMSPVLEVLYIIQMWTGRLEIIPVLVMLRAVAQGVRSRIA